MAVDVQRTLDFGNARRIVNLPDATDPQHPATLAQLNAAIEGINWKDSCRVSTQGNLNLSSPGSTIDGITMSTGDRVLVRAQTTVAQNGIYVWNGAAVAMTRALDASTAAELEQATVTVEEGTNAGVTYRQTQVNFTLDSGDVIFTTFGTSAGAASETSAGIAEIATQAEVDAGTDDNRFVTPLKLAAWSAAATPHKANVGDGSATQYDVTHNFNTFDVVVEVFRNSGNRDTVLAEVQRPSVNAVRVLFDTAPSSNAYRVIVTKR